MVDEIKKPEAPAEDAEKAKSEEKKLETEEKIVDKGIKVDIEADSSREADRVNAEIRKEEKAEKKPESEKKSQKVEKKEDGEPITEEYRKRYNVPAHIKTHGALTKWGPEAEKKMAQTLSERDRLNFSNSEAEKRLSKLEAILENITQKKVDDGGMSEAERLVRENKLRELDESGDRVAYAEEIKRQIREDAVKEAQTREDETARTVINEAVEKTKKQQAEDFQVLFDKYGKEKFEKEIAPALGEIAKRDPTMTSVANLHKIYLYELREAEDNRNAEDEAKRKEKEGSSSEVSHRVAEESGSKDEKEIAEMKAIDANDPSALAKLNKLMGVKEN